MSIENDKAFVDALRATTVVKDISPAGSLAVPEVLGTRSWFDARRKAFRSSGGRPTDPRWTIKRAIPFAEETWSELNRLAVRFSGSAVKLGPGQVAACLLEEAVKRAGDGGPSALICDRKASVAAAIEVLDVAEPRFKEWRPHGVFAGIADTR